MKKKYRVYGHTTVNVTVEVFADSEESAKEAAYDELDELIAYCGNGGTDKLVGVGGENMSVCADCEIVYDDFEYLGEVDDD